MLRSTLKRLLIYTVEDSISKLQNIDQERFVKIQKYNKKKNEYIYNANDDIVKRKFSEMV
jgi:hypothetical protein